MNCTWTPAPTLGCIGQVIANLIQALFYFLGAAALLFLIWGSLKYIMAHGDPKALAGARSTITYALIGAVLVLCVFAIINFVETFLGLPKGTLQTFSFGQ